MKKIIAFILAGIFMFILVGCNMENSKLQQNLEAMYIKPSEFSQETLDVLELFNDEIQFFDISINDTAKSHTVAIWVYRDGEWVEAGKTYGETKFLGGRYAIRLTESSCDLYSINNNGHTKYTYPKLDTPFDETTMKMGWKLDHEEIIELNKEIPLWVMIGSNVSSFQNSDMQKDFRELECTAGVAITITVSDKIQE